jgi:hypothetical protein
VRRLLFPFLAAVLAVPALVGAPAAQADSIYGPASFRATCPFSHRAHNDPIVFPGDPGASHSHEFFGSEQTNANTTTKKLRTNPTTCDPGGDKSAYWVPTLYENGYAVPVGKAQFYYTTEDDWTGPRVRSFPRGLRVIAGNAAAPSPDPYGPYRWSCFSTGEPASTEEFPDCGGDQRLKLFLEFPECWNGEDKDSPDHKSHMAYRVDGACPPSHPVPVPRLLFKLRYDSDGGPDTTLARMAGGVHSTDAPAYTAHGDFWNAWGRETLREHIQFCLVAHEITCDEDAAIPEE